MAAVCAALQKPCLAEFGKRNASFANRASSRTSVRVIAQKQEQKVRREQCGDCV